jgi:DNA-directed RNA polymerase subunit RPC12/RpoP
MQKRICTKCSKPVKKNYVTIEADDTRLYLCADCLAQNRTEMLADPNHPAWKYFDAVAKALGLAGRAKTND